MICQVFFNNSKITVNLLDKFNIISCFSGYFSVNFYIFLRKIFDKYIMLCYSYSVILLCFKEES